MHIIMHNAFDFVQKHILIPPFTCKGSFGFLTAQEDKRRSNGGMHTFGQNMFS